MVVRQGQLFKDNINMFFTAFPLHKFHSLPDFLIIVIFSAYIEHCVWCVEKHIIMM